ncbi:uncharacterized protein PgNI_07795 [Pyricularia grisea]|uniref:Uncharacterized protein n=1 Tax=Pyricularia grisea TaxID=148305 RepID=A0A6P8B239_PYRGI|nr:uncharacterized protein PgNI_07795 [Pyricularia grisea]TLD08927.1 hypothetical protein PgNI_07795 [Pyricularia grisea]
MTGEKSTTAAAAAQTTIDNPQTSATSVKHDRVPSTPISEDTVYLDKKEADRLGRQRLAVFSSTPI